jgi:hypothetical protein
MKFHPHQVQQVLPNECVRCSVASLLGLPREEVPNFMDTPPWLPALEKWLDYRGLLIEVHDRSLDVNVEYYLGQGVKNGVGHCVVMRDGKVWHDPSGIGIDHFEAWLIIRQKINDVEPTFYASILPTLKEEARKHGYALILHGSMQRDMDLVAVPWVEKCSPGHVLAEAILKRSGTFTAPSDKPTFMPHGRVAWRMYFGGHHYLDLSVMPKMAPEDEQQRREDAKEKT